MKKRLKKKIISACFDKLPIELYKDFLYKKCMYNVVSSYHNLVKKGKKDGYEAYVSITGPEGTVYKNLKK